MGGTLADTLNRYRTAGTPWKVIARLLAQDYGVEVAADTLTAWAAELGVEAPDRKASGQ